MQSRSTPPHRNGALLARAARQHGVVSRADLRTLGFDDAAVRRRVESGLLRRVHPGVFAGGQRLTPEGLYLAAVRAAGDAAVLSHRAAAAHWHLLRYDGTIVDVLLPHGRGARSRTGIRIHRTRRPIEHEVRDGIPVTTVARTLADLTEVVPLRKLEKALEQADRLDRLDVSAIDAIAGADPGRRGPGLVARLVRAHDTQSFTRSELEDAFVEFCDRHGLPPPATNARVEGMEVDAVWVQARLVVELDSGSWHKTRERFRSDRAKSRRLTVLGWTALRVTDAEMDEEPELIAREIRALLRPAA
jgi:hypothetical protein